LETIWNV